MNKKLVALTLGIMCLLLTMAIAMQYKTVQDANKVIGSTSSELKSEVLAWKEKYDSAYKELTKEEKQLEKTREVASKKNSTSAESEKELKTLNAMIGTTDVTGPGIEITIADNSNVTSDSVGVFGNVSDYLIHDMDLLTILNELKNAGAEAISINDQRVTNYTSITCDGNVVLVNDQKISSPFTIKAIGSQEALLGAIQRPGGYLERLKEYGLVSSVEKKTNLMISKYDGVMNYKYIRKVE